MTEFIDLNPREHAIYAVINQRVASLEFDQVIGSGYACEPDAIKALDKVGSANRVVLGLAISFEPEDWAAIHAEADHRLESSPNILALVTGTS